MLKAGVFSEERRGFKEGETGFFVPQGCGASVGPDVSHKLYTVAASSCFVIAGVNPEIKQGFLVHVTPLHDFSAKQLTFDGDRINLNNFGEINEHLIKFSNGGGKLFVIKGRRVPVELLNACKSFFRRNKITYELREAPEAQANILVDHQLGLIQKCASVGAEPAEQWALRFAALRGGGMRAVHESGKTRIKSEGLIHSRFHKLTESG